MHIDLHTHTTASDGQLSINALIHRAQTLGIELLSITDHDTTAAYNDLTALTAKRLTVIPGIEFSTRWRKIDIHILGLNIDPDSDAIKTCTGLQRKVRSDRAMQIATKLEKLGVTNPLPRVKQIAGNGNIGRPHFAQHLVETGFVKDINQAFDKYLSAGKPAYFRQHWTPVPQLIESIKAAGGTAVLAHPAKYKLTRTKLNELVDEFKEAGGEGIEVISGMQVPNLTRDLARLCETKKMLASCGSDFHQPGQSWAELGRYPPLPKSCRPVWDCW